MRLGLLPVSAVLAGEEVLVGDVGVDVALWVFQAVDDHVVVQHLALVDAGDGVQLVLALGLGVGPSLLPLGRLLVAHQDNGGDQDQDGDQGRKGGDHGDPRAGRRLAAGTGSGQGHDGAVGQDVTRFAGISGQTLALEVVDSVDAEAIVQAGAGIALVDLGRAVFAGESGRASADESGDLVVAGAAVGARIDGAIVDILLAVLAGEAGSAGAGVVVDQVDALTAVLARVDGAIVDVDLAVVAGEADRTLAHVAVGTGTGLQAGASVLAGRGATLVNFHIAVEALVAGCALALVAHRRGGPAVVGQTLGTVFARAVRTVTSNLLAILASISNGANALVVIGF